MTSPEIDPTALLHLVEGHDGGAGLLRLALAELREACPECARVYAEFERRQADRIWTDPARFPDWTPPGAPEGAALPAAADPAARERRAAARADLAVLRRNGAAVHVRIVRQAHRRMNSPELVELLIEAARDQRGDKAKKGLALLDVAAEVAKRLAEPAPGVAPRLKLRIDAHRANKLRVLGELQDAAEIWPQVHDQLRRWPLPTPQAEAELWWLEASLRRALREFDEAERLLRRAEILYRLAGDTHGLAEVYLNLGTLAAYRGEAEEGLRWTERATEEIDPVTDPRLFWQAYNNLAESLVALGRPVDAGAVLEVAKPALLRCADESNLRRLAWVEAKIARALGRTDEAEFKLKDVCADWSALGFAYDAALAGLDLADLYRDTGRSQDLARLAKSMVKLFQIREVSPEARAAMDLFAQAAQEQRANAALTAGLRRYLEGVRADPRLAFAPGAGGGEPPRPPE